MDCRKDFPIFQNEPFIYFDTAATAHKPQCVIDAISSFYSSDYATVHRGVYTKVRNATELYHKAREKVQHFIGANSSDEIVFTRGTTASLNFLARAFATTFLMAGDVILLSEIEHHSNLVPWQMIAQEKGLILRFIPVDDAGTICLRTLDTMLDGVKLVSLAHMSNVLGTIHPVKEIIKKAHAKGAYVCLDGAQAAAHLPLNVKDLDVDFYAFSGHKLYGPTGIGVLYGKKELLEQLLPFEGGGDMVDKVSLRQATYNILPYKFEAGTPMIAEAIGLGAALDYLSSIGMDTIRLWEQELVLKALEEIKKVPRFKILGKQQGSILSFLIEGSHPLDIATLLDCRGIAIRSGHHCSQPTMERFKITSCCRLSFGIYNTFEEINFFISNLFEILKLV